MDYKIERRGIMLKGAKPKKAIVIILVLAVAVSAYILSDKLWIKTSVDNIFYGTAEADQIDITTEISGKIKEIMVQEGDIVNKQDLIATIDASESKIKLEQAELSIENANNELEKVVEGSRREEIKVQQALVSQAEEYIKQLEVMIEQATESINSAQTTYEFKKKIYDDIKALYNNDATSAQELENAEFALDNAEHLLNNAKHALSSAEAQLKIGKAQLEAAEQKLKLLVNGATKNTKDTAKYGIEQAEKGYELSKLVTEKSNIRTNYSGILELINYKVGEFVAPGTPIATVLDTSNIWVKIFIPESELSKISLGKELKIKCDFVKDSEMKGKVIYISPKAEFTPMNVVTKQDRLKLVYAVKIKLIDSTDKIKPGMLLDVHIE